MDSFFKTKSTNTDTNTEANSKHHQPSSTELFASAKYVAEAAKSTFSGESDKVDKVKAAGAAEDLLGAASRYGNLKEKGFGQYVEKAETYLHQYAHSTTAANPSGHSVAPGAEHASVPSGHSGSIPSGGGDEKSGSGVGDYFKMAEGFLKKN